MRKKGSENMPTIPTPEHHPRSSEENERSWREVSRAHEVVIVGDLHGKYEALQGNGESAGLFTKDARGNNRWTGKDKKAVFVGDILGDRSLDGIDILQELHELNEQAEKSGGSITLLAGNHDNWALSYILGEDSVDNTSQKNITEFMLARPAPEDRPGKFYSNQGIGILSFPFLYRNHVTRDDIPTASNFIDLSQEKKYNLGISLMNDENLWKEIRAHIAASTEFQKILNMYKIAHIIDDTLILHCDPTQEITKDLLRRAKEEGSLMKAVEKLNATYQENLKRCLANVHEAPTKEYRDIGNIYLATKNREEDQSRETIRSFRSYGINAIAHGHSIKYNYPTTHMPEEFLIMSVDKGAFKKGSGEMTRSIATIKKSGNVSEGAFQSPLREV